MLNRTFELSQQIKVVLTDMISSVSGLVVIGVYDIRHQLSIIIDPTNTASFWDNDAFDKLEQIITNSPISPVDFIYVDLQQAYCLIRPIRPATYWILVYQMNISKSNLIHPYNKWEHQILEIIQKLDDASI